MASRMDWTLVGKEEEEEEKREGKRGDQKREKNQECTQPNSRIYRNEKLRMEGSEAQGL